MKSLKNKPVVVLRDIYRYSDFWVFIDGKPQRPKLLYAREGQKGICIDEFQQGWTKVHHVKVVIDGVCRTFRRTSVAEIKD